MLVDSPHNLQNRYGLASSRVKVPRFLRHCPACATMQRSLYGECYWRRSHQVPGCTACPEHGCWLVGTQVPYRIAGLRPYPDAERAVPCSEPEEADRHDLEVSRLCVEALAEATRSFPARPEGDSMTPAFPKGVGGRTLTREFIDLHGARALERIGCSLDPDDPHNWLLGILRRPTGRFHPVQCVLARRFSMDREGTARPGTRRVRTPHRARRVNVSEVPELRRRWEQVLDDTPGRSRLLAARSCRPVYERLALLDRDWLFKEPRRYNRAPANQRRVDWRERDSIVSVALEKAGARIAAAVPVRRVTRSALIRETKLKSGFLGQLPRLPLCREVIDRCLEDLDTYHVRLLARVADELRSEGRAISVAALRRRSKLTGPIGPGAAEAARALSCSDGGPDPTAVER